MTSGPEIKIGTAEKEQQKNKMEDYCIEEVYIKVEPDEFLPEATGDFFCGLDIKEESLFIDDSSNRENCRESSIFDELYSSTELECKRQRLQNQPLAVQEDLRLETADDRRRRLARERYQRRVANMSQEQLVHRRETRRQRLQNQDLEILVDTMETAAEKRRRLARERYRKRMANLSQEQLELRKEARRQRLQSQSYEQQEARKSRDKMRSAQRRANETEAEANHRRELQRQRRAKLLQNETEESAAARREDARKRRVRFLQNETEEAAARRREDAKRRAREARKNETEEQTKCRREKLRLRMRERSKQKREISEMKEVDTVPPV